MNRQARQDHQRRTVLLVEDDVRVRQALTQLLHWSNEWRVIGEAADESGALALAGALHPDLILLDLWLAEGDGLHLLPLLHALTPDSLILVLSVASEAALEAQALALGAHGYLAKTSPPTELLAVLRSLHP